jgi:DNA-binding LacI/PurR family transcriptional regulator
MADPPTLAQVAAAAGVSPATASRVLTGSVRVSTSARRQVHEAMANLGYVRRRAPRSARPNRPPTSAVAAVICEPPTRLFSDPFFPRVIAGAEEALARHAVPLLLVPTSGDTLAAIERYLISGAVDGVLLISAHSRHPLAVSLPAARVAVRCAGRPADAGHASYVDVDNRGGARRAVEHLLRRGCRSIATIAGPPDLSAAADRLTGYRDALDEAGVPPLPVAYGDFTQVSGAHAMGWLLHRVPHLDAVFVASDLMAVGAMHALHRANRRVPEDVAVIGFDDAPAARLTRPALTTVRQPVEELGELAAELLLAEIAGHDVTRENPILPTELIIRETA